MAAGGLTSAGQTRWLNTFTGVSPYSLPSVYMALMTGTSSAASAGTEVTTGQYTGYARQALPGANWGDAATDASYQLPITFGNNTSGTGATITYWELYDASSGGNRLVFSTFDQGNIILPANGGEVQFAATAVSWFQLPSSGFHTSVGPGSVYQARMVNHFNGKTTYVGPSAWWAYLATSYSTGNTIGTESTYTNYARVQVASPTTFFGPANFSGFSLSSVSTAQNLTFPTVGASVGSTIIEMGFMDASSGGNIVGTFQPFSGITLVTGQTPQYASGSVIITIT